jgi:pentatricopeptide repeat protein
MTQYLDEMVGAKLTVLNKARRLVDACKMFDEMVRDGLIPYGVSYNLCVMSVKARALWLILVLF